MEVQEQEKKQTNRQMFAIFLSWHKLNQVVVLEKSLGFIVVVVVFF